jgi:hypothetical protein
MNAQPQAHPGAQATELPQNRRGTSSLRYQAIYKAQQKPRFTAAFVLRKAIRRLRRGSFRFQGNRFPYFDHPHNTTWENERAIEIPIIWRHVRQCAGEVLEAGNVLSYYFRHRHDVVDKYDPTPGIINEDLEYYLSEKRYDLIVSISTLEHIGWDEEPKDENKPLRVLEQLKKNLSPRGRIVFTIPLGHNPPFDRQLYEKRVALDEVFFMRRVSQANAWREERVAEAALAEVRYNFPFPKGNGVLIGVLGRS